MKKNNKKGFTIVELVIVIAVIAILAAVLIPTFSGVVEKAKQNAALQEAKNAYTAIVATDVADGKQDGQEGTVAIPLTGYNGTIVYTCADNKCTEFTFTKDTIKWTLNPTTGEWTYSSVSGT